MREAGGPGTGAGRGDSVSASLKAGGPPDPPGQKKSALDRPSASARTQSLQVPSDPRGSGSRPPQSSVSPVGQLGVEAQAWPSVGADVLSLRRWPRGPRAEWTAGA